MTSSKRPGAELLEKVDRILSSQEREERATQDTKEQISRLNGQVVSLSSQVQAVTIKVDGIMHDLGGQGGEPRIRERMVVIETRLHDHDESIQDIRDQGKTEKANRWALWLTILGAMLLTAVTALVKYMVNEG